ncbi:hypothetical protein DFH09DRAFT_1095683 [Mycena vulgaris]|nr:hypothetical protein DFH09DRAFT_1095683 [Mycena vulgaris]
MNMQLERGRCVHVVANGVSTFRFRLEVDIQHCCDINLCKLNLFAPHEMKTTRKNPGKIRGRREFSANDAAAERKTRPKALKMRASPGPRRLSSRIPMSTANPSLDGGDPRPAIANSLVLDATQRDGTLRVWGADADLTASDEKILSLVPPGRYTYHPIGAIAPFPASSASTSYSTMMTVSDDWCAVTGDRSRRLSSHLVPEAEARLEVINSPPNCLAMGADLGGPGMDQGHFVFAPYAGKAVCVYLTDGLADFVVDYHLRSVEIPARIHPMDVYVRFAWGLEISSNADRSSADALGNDERRLLTDDNDSAQESSSDAALEPPLDMYTFTEYGLEAAESLDAAFDRRPFAHYEQAAGMYRGFSKVMRLQHE